MERWNGGTVISLDRVNARAGEFRLVDISFEVPDGGYGVVIGTAGAGKTTLLETIAGVIPVTSGRVSLGGRDCTSQPPEQRGLGIVYQHAYLFPHLSVRENIAYGAASEEDAREITERFGLGSLAERSVDALSGGERQLVAIARALARRPSVLLLDEPFSALDPRSRNSARRLLRAVYEERRFTALQVTHDFAEAGLLGDVAIVLDGGRVVQSGAPEIVFRQPASAYIADFLGAENVFAGVVSLAPSDAATGSWSVSDEYAQRALVFTTGELTFFAISDVAEGPAHAVIRAEEVSISVDDSRSSIAATASMSSVRNQFRGRILEIASTGALSHVTVEASGTPIVAAVTGVSVQELGLAVGKEVGVAFKATAVHLC
ncbi:MAG TPA: ABC transporter ATP-binding protein [Gemmatimonadaceae bacterium]